MTIQRAEWERRWSADPSLRPEVLRWDAKYNCWFQFTDCEKSEAGIYWFEIDDATATALIVARAVEWLADEKGLYLRRAGPRWLISCATARLSDGSYSTLLDALEAAVDAVLAGRKEPNAVS